MGLEFSPAKHLLYIEFKDKEGEFLCWLCSVDKCLNWGQLTREEFKQRIIEKATFHVLEQYLTHRNYSSVLTRVDPVCYRCHHSTLVHFDLFETELWEIYHRQSF